MIRVRLRPGKDDDIAAWYEGQENRSEAVRRAIRAYIQHGGGVIDQKSPLEAISRELARLPDVVADAVRSVLPEALAAYCPSPSLIDEQNPGAEDPELAARLEAQLDDLFGS